MDNLANLFSIIQNGQNRYKIVVKIPFSKRSWSICNVLFIEGLLKGFLLKENSIYIFLKYSQNKPVIKKIEKLSLQGRRLYIKKGISTLNQDQFPLYKISKNLNSLNNNNLVKDNLLSSTSCSSPLRVPLVASHRSPVPLSFSTSSNRSPAFDKVEKNEHVERTNNFMKKQENSHFFRLRLLSTSQGIMTERDSKFLQIGGELLCEIS